MANEYVETIRENEVIILRLNRPEAKNSLNRTMLGMIADAVSRFSSDNSVRGMIITGAGNSFCAGADIAEMASMTPLEAARYAEIGQGIMFSIEKVGKPVVAAVNGYAIGGGLELALACDFVFAAHSALFAAPEITLGIIPGFGGTQRLLRAIGKPRAKELIYTGNRIDARTACDIGLVNKVCEDDKLVSETLATMKRICSMGSVSLGLAKETIDNGAATDLRSACILERDAFALCFASEEQREGMNAFLEKRPARFQGK